MKKENKITDIMNDQEFEAWMTRVLSKTRYVMTDEELKDIQRNAEI